MRYVIGYWVALIIFAVAALVAVVMSPIAYFTQRLTYADHLFRTLSRLFAALLGRSGRYSFSAECGMATSGFYLRARRIVDWMLGPNHCANEAANERMQ